MANQNNRLPQLIVQTMVAAIAMAVGCGEQEHDASSLAQAHGPKQCQHDEYFAAYNEAIEGTHGVGCEVDSDCVITTDLPLCLPVCAAAIPKVRESTFHSALNGKIDCETYQPALCQGRPVPSCAAVKATCAEHKCKAVATE